MLAEQMLDPRTLINYRKINFTSKLTLLRMLKKIKSRDWRHLVLIRNICEPALKRCPTPVDWAKMGFFQPLNFRHGGCEILFFCRSVSSEHGKICVPRKFLSPVSC